jgi:hypothetical protein
VEIEHVGGPTAPASEVTGHPATPVEIKHPCEPDGPAGEGTVSQFNPVEHKYPGEPGGPADEVAGHKSPDVEADSNYDPALDDNLAPMSNPGEISPIGHIDRFPHSFSTMKLSPLGKTL